MPAIIMAPIFIPAAPPQKSDETIIYEQSVLYSTSESSRRAFEDGALYWKHRTDSCPSGFQVLGFIFAFFYFAMFLGTFIIGILEKDGSYSSNYNRKITWDTKFKIVFPSYNFGRIFGQWFLNSSKK